MYIYIIYTLYTTRLFHCFLPSQPLLVLQIPQTQSQLLLPLALCNNNYYFILFLFYYTQFFKTTLHMKVKQYIIMYNYKRINYCYGSSKLQLNLAEYYTIETIAHETATQTEP